MLGIVCGDLLGRALGMKTNVGGVGIAMLLLIVMRLWLHKHGRLCTTSESGVNYSGANLHPGGRRDGDAAERRGCPTRWADGIARGDGECGQGQRSLKRCSGKDFQQELFVPTTTVAFHDEARAVGMLLQE